MWNLKCTIDYTLYYNAQLTLESKQRRCIPISFKIDMQADATVVSTYMYMYNVTYVEFNKGDWRAYSRHQLDFDKTFTAREGQGKSNKCH